MSKVAIIVGVTSQDGAYLSKLLLSKDYKVFGIARRVSTDNLQRLRELNILNETNFHLVRGDVTDTASLRKCFINASSYTTDDILEVYNLSAMSHVGISFEQPELTMAVNYGGVVNLLEIIQSSYPKTKFYQASSSEMYGSSFDEDCDGKYQDENTIFKPVSPYAVSKLSSHHLVNIYRNSYGIHASSGILMNHESPLRGEEFVTKKIAKYVAQIYHKKTNVQLELGNLAASRDWGHSKNYVNAMWLMLQQNKPDDYVISTGATFTVEDFLREAFYRIDIANFMDYVRINPEFFRPLEVDYLCGRSTKANKILGWKSDITFHDLVTEMIDYEIQKAAA